MWNTPAACEIRCEQRVGGFHFTWCDSIKFHNLRSKLFHRERKRTISLKTNGYVRVRIHMQKQQKYLFLLFTKLVKINGHIKEWKNHLVLNNLCPNEVWKNCSKVRCTKRWHPLLYQMLDVGYPTSRIEAFSKNSQLVGLRLASRAATSAQASPDQNLTK